MEIQEMIAELNSALAIVDSLLLSAEDEHDVKTYNKLYERINSVYCVLVDEVCK